MMRFGLHIVLVFFMLFPAISATAQRAGDDKIANQYFNHGEFDKASVYYIKLYKKTKATSYFDRYIECLVNIEQLKEAEKALTKEIKRRPNHLVWRVTLGNIYQESGRRKEAVKTWDETIKRLKANPGEIVSVARQFTAIGQAEYALKAYEKGKQNIQGFYTFNVEMAELYGSLGAYDKMIDLYLELIEVNPAYLQTVQNLLNRNFNFSEPDDQTRILKERLIRKVNQYPDNIIYAEMLIWMYLQENNFNSAFMQVRALDKRFKEDGRRVLNMARLAAINKSYKVALDAYNYLISKGVDNKYYAYASVEKLNTRKKQLEENPMASKDDYQSLAENYRSVIETLGINDQTAPALRDLAAIDAKELDNIDRSIALLENALSGNKLSKKEKALTKIDLGDYLLMRGEIWDASLYYMQAEKAFKYDETGDVAKLKVAKIAYYTGDFQWAKAQLDVLKGSTSKLISNDALYLSNLISDNTGLDTSEVPMQMFARADLMIVQKKYAPALLLLDSIKNDYPGHMLDDDILMQEYKVYLAQGRYHKAAEKLNAIYTTYGYDILADDALFKLAELYQYYLNDEEKAKSLYLELMTTYDASIYVNEARRRYRSMRGDTLE